MKSYPLMIRESHIDTFGHVNNASYLQMMEEARWQMITEGGYGLDKVRETQQGPVILEVNLKFLHELQLREKINIQTELIEYRGKIGKLRQTVVKENNQLAADATFVFGLFDLKIRKLIDPTAAWKLATSSIRRNT